jgi:hypothetical protein
MYTKWTTSRKRSRKSASRGLSRATSSKVAQHLTKTVPKLLGLRLDNELLKVVCSCIETLVDSRKTGLDKKELVLLIWSSLYPDITEQELKLVDVAIDFLCSNKLVVSLKKCRNIFSFFSKNQGQ